MYVMEEPVLYKGFLVYRSGKVEVPVEGGENVVVEPREYTARNKQSLIVRLQINGEYNVGDGFVQLRKLVFDAFGGKRKSGLIEHIDNDYKNCSFDNLVDNGKEPLVLESSTDDIPNVMYHDYVIYKNGVIKKKGVNGKLSIVKQVIDEDDSEPSLGVRIRVNGKIKFSATRNIIYDAFNGEQIQKRYLGHRDGDFMNCSLDNLYVRGSGINDPGLDFSKLTKHKEKYLADKDYACSPPPLSRYAAHRSGHVVNMITGNVLKGCLNKALDYFGHILKSDLNEEIFRYTHRFVYECFFPDFDKTTQVDHDDENTHNNAINNLVSRSSEDHNKKTLLQNPQRSAKIGISLGKPIICTSRETGEVIHTFHGVGAAAKALKINGSNLRKILNSEDNVSRCGTQLWFWKPDTIEGESWYKITYDVTDEHAPEGIKGLVGLEVSDMCRIRSYSGKITIGTKHTEDAYLRFFYNGKHRTIHQVMCFLYHGVPQHKDMTVDHWDIDKLNNFGYNLRWATQKQQGENTSTTRRVIGTKTNGHSKVYNSLVEASKDFNVTPTYISRLCLSGKVLNNTIFSYDNSEKNKLYDYVVVPDPSICIAI